MGVFKSDDDNPEMVLYQCSKGWRKEVKSRRGCPAGVDSFTFVLAGLQVQLQIEKSSCILMSLIREQPSPRSASEI